MNVNLRNKKTTIFGSLAGVFLGLSGVPQLGDYKEILLGFAGLVRGTLGLLLERRHYGSTPEGM